MLQIKCFVPRELVVKYFSAFFPKGILEVDFRILIAAGNLEVAHTIWLPHGTDGETRPRGEQRLALRLRAASVKAQLLAIGLQASILSSGKSWREIRPGDLETIPLTEERLEVHECLAAAALVSLP